MLEMEKSLAALRATAVEENRPVRTHASLPAPGRVVAWRDACLPALCVARRRGRSLACGAPRPGRAPRGRGAPAVHRWRPPRHAPRPVRMHLSCVHPVHAHASQIIKKNCTFDSNRRGSMVIDATPSYPGQRPSSAPCASLGAPGGSGQRGTSRGWGQGHWAPSHCPGCSSEPPPRSPIPPPAFGRPGSPRYSGGSIPYTETSGGRGDLLELST